MFYGGGEIISSADGESKREDRTMKSNPKPRSRKVARKEFLTDPKASAAPGISFLAGAEGDPVSEEKKQQRPRSNRLTKGIASRQGFGDLVEISSPIRPASDLILSNDAMDTLSGVANEFRRGDEVRRHGLKVRSKLLFCGPPGCGKTMCAEVMASELHLPLVVARLDAIIASHLGETASNLRKIFDAAKEKSMILFLDEFDALARARSDTNEHNEIRRVVNSLLMMIDEFESRSILIAATNLEETVDRAIWRRFDEVVEFEKPTKTQVRRLLKIKTRNFPAEFELSGYADQFVGMSFAQVERACLSAIRTSILARKESISEHAFRSALLHEQKRAKIDGRILR